MALPVVSPTLISAEIVASTLIADGPHAGQSCALVRLGGCNLTCSWCDVPWTWDASRYDIATTLRRRAVPHLVDEVLAASPSVVLITGGEPLLQQKSLGWQALLVGLSTESRRPVTVEVHTNGTKAPHGITLAAVHRFVVSPKLTHSGEPAWNRLKDDALAVWAQLAREGRAAFSFVVRDRMDVLTVAQLSQLHDIPGSRIWISPEGRTGAEIAAVTGAVLDTVVRHRFNLTRRMLFAAA
jgi:7-carboxy-7-deazaguanine synthase